MRTVARVSLKDLEGMGLFIGCVEHEDSDEQDFEDAQHELVDQDPFLAALVSILSHPEVRGLVREALPSPGTAEANHARRRLRLELAFHEGAWHLQVRRLTKLRWTRAELAQLARDYPKGGTPAVRVLLSICVRLLLFARVSGGCEGCGRIGMRPA